MAITMKEIANIIADCILENLQLEKLMKNVEQLNQRFQTKRVRRLTKIPVISLEFVPVYPK